MKNLKKLIVIVTLAALLICLIITASADDRIYTSPAFRLPADRISDWADYQAEQAALEAEEAQPEEGAEPAEGEPVPEGEPVAEVEVPADGEPVAEQPATEGEPAAEQPATEGEPVEEQPAAEGEPTAEQPAAEGEPAAEQPVAEGEPVAEPAEGEPEAQAAEEAPAGPVRRVRIYSSQGEVVTEGEIIYLTSVLEGFDGVNVSFQWQVDRGDGAGWVDVEGANRPKHMFVANRETIQYSWRLIVEVIE